LFDDAIAEIRRGIRELERQVRNLRLHQDIIEITMEHALRSILMGIEEIDRGIITLEATMKLTESNLPRMVVSYEVGVISRNDLRDIEQSIIQTGLQLSDLRRARIDIIQSMNNLLGLPITQMTEVSFSIYEISVPDDLESHMERLIRNAPSIRQLQIAIDSAVAERNAYVGNNRNIRITESDRRRAMKPAVNNDQIRSLRNRINLQDAVDRANLAKIQGMRTMEVALRQAFREQNSLFSRLAAQHLNLDHAKSSLASARVSLETGRITQFELEQAQLAVLVAEHVIDSLYLQKWHLAFTLENPVLLIQQ